MPPGKLTSEDATKGGERPSAQRETHLILLPLSPVNKVEQRSLIYACEALGPCDSVCDWQMKLDPILFGVRVHRRCSGCVRWPDGLQHDCMVAVWQ